MFDLGSSAAEMARVVSGVRDHQLTDPTPCPDWTVADLLAHVHQFTTVFTDNARKAPAHPPESLVDDWREAIPRGLDELVAAWRDESAWHGRTSAGGVDMAAADNAVVAIEELTTHGWDLARATGQDFEASDTALDQVARFFDLFGDAPFGPAGPVPRDATRLHRVLARTGRDPQWSAAR